MNLKEIGLYLRIRGEIDESTRRLIEEIYPTADGTPFYCRYGTYDIAATDAGIELVGTGVVLTGELAKRHFDNCSKIIVILGTMGIESERRIKSFFSVSPTRGVVLDACYSEVIERRLDEKEKELGDGSVLTSRISCGYGDLPINLQGKLLDLIEGERIGVYMNESCMLTPNKSVVALVGVKK